VDINELTVQEQRGYRNNKRIGRNGYVRRSDNTGGFTGQGLISFIRSGTHRKTRDHDPQSQRRVRATRLAPIVRSIDRDGITSCQSRSRTVRPAILRTGTADERRYFDVPPLIDRWVRVLQPVPRYQSHDRTK